MSLLVSFRILYELLFYGPLKIIALLGIHYNVLPFGIGAFNQENIFDTGKLIIHIFLVKPWIMCIEVPSD